MSDVYRSQSFCAGETFFPEGFATLLRHVSLSSLDTPGIPWEIDTGLPREAYELSLFSDRTSIRAGSDCGVLWAFRTLADILDASNVESDSVRPSNGNSISCRRVTDLPDLAWRGVMLDVSRSRVWTVEYLKGLIVTLSGLRYNHLQLYTEHTFAYSGHEEVWKDSSPYTADEIREIVAYALDWGIAVGANQNSYGHMERWLQHERYRPLAEIDGGFTDPWGMYHPHPSTLSPAVEGTYTFLDGLYKQLLPLFAFPFANLGGDEPWEHCQGKSSGLGTPAEVLTTHLERISDLAHTYGKSTMVWADTVVKYPEAIDKLPKEMVFAVWGYESDSPIAEQCSAIAALGRKLWVCPGTSGWNSVGGRWMNARANISLALAAGREYKAEGMLLTDWGDNGHWQQPVIMIPGVFLAGALAWNSEVHMDDEVIAKRIFQFGYMTHDEALALVSLGKMPNLDSCKLLNITLPNACFIDCFYSCHREKFKLFKDYCFDADRNALRATLSLVKTESTVARQLRFSGKLMELSFDFADDFLRTEGFDAHALPTEKKVRYARAIRELLAEYRSLWLECSRPGGLEESASLLEGIALYLEEKGIDHRNENKDHKPD